MLLFVVGVPERYSELVNPCGADCADRLLGALDADQRARLSEIGINPRLYAWWDIGREALLAAACVVLGTLLIRRVGTVVAFLTATVLAAYGGVLVPETSIAAERAGVLPAGVDPAVWIVAMTTISVPWFLLPSGRFVPRWSWVPAIATAGAWISLPLLAENEEPPPVLFLVALALLGVGVGAQVYRYRRASTSIERQQLKWLGIGLAGWVASLIVYLTAVEAELLDPEAAGLTYPLGYVAFGVLATGAALVFPFAWAVAILQHRLWDADRVLSRGALALTLTSLLLGTYLVVVFVVASVADDHTEVAGSIAALLMVVMALLLREPVTRRVTRLFYGRRDAPYELLASLWATANQHLANATTLELLTSQLVESLHLSAGQVQVTGDTGGVFDHTIGSAHGDPAVVPLESSGEQVGTLKVWPRLGESRLSTRDLQLIGNASAPLAHVASTVRLTGDLRRSQAALVSAGEEERRRIHRDLHDDLGPALAGQALLLDAAASTIDTDAERARELVERAKYRTDGVVEHIRALARDLRPVALDQLGLAPSLRQAASVAANGSARVEADIDELPDLPAATETAAYRIITEALTNALRHSHATSIHLRVGANGDRIVATVEDDGRGGAPAKPNAKGHGVGMRSMFARASELGGDITVTSHPDHGTTVQMELPVIVDA